MVEPRSGDLVRVRTTDDVLIPPGSLGLIMNPNYSDPEWTGNVPHVTVVFNFYTPWLTSDGSAVASGGPVRVIPRDKLKDTGEVVKVKFQRWKSLPGSDVELVEKEVRVFEVDL